ncbi:MULTISPECIES: hypothetical protein [unclassified Sinorhizobium]|uniref:hypothetical protein n=1 Tax=unclassified Sinorhizobium TaxID=2613772 RepID=UPI003525D40D
MRSSIDAPDRASAVLEILRANNVNLKLRDAELLIEAVVKMPDRRLNPEFSWAFNATSFWKSMFPESSQVFARPKLDPDME